MEYAEKNNRPEAVSFLQKNHKDKFVRIPLTVRGGGGGGGEEVP